MRTDGSRLIEVAFPLRQASLDSVHEKNVRHGHVSTLHIWPARRPLAACRAALIATLLADPGDTEGRNAVLERMAGRVVEKVGRKRVNGRLAEQVKEETAGGILHWGRENGADLEWFRTEIRRAYGGRPPRLLDPFAGGGAIPLEAIRLGCDASAMDINPVAWFILKCTLEYPQRLAGRKHPLPGFAVRDAEFMAAFLKAHGFKGATLRTVLQRLGHDHGEVQLDLICPGDPLLDADLAWQVRAWGRWVLAQARREFARYYPTYAEYEPLERGRGYDRRPLHLVAVDEAGVPRLDTLNVEFDPAELSDPRTPRWIVKPTVAYLWARTVACKQCRAPLPLLKTRWLCKKERKRVLLTMAHDPSQAGVVFGVQVDVPQSGGNAAQRREHDRGIGTGTMSRAGAKCPCCGAIMTMADIRVEGRAGRLGAVLTAVVVDGRNGKEYRLPTDHERAVAEVTEEQLRAVYAETPFGLPEEEISADRPSPNSRGASGLPRYGFDTWRELFTGRQLLLFARLIAEIPRCAEGFSDCPEAWREAIVAYVALAFSKLTDYSSAGCSWHNGRETLRQTFARYALPMVWDYCEVNPLADTTGGFLPAVEWVARALGHLDEVGARPHEPSLLRGIHRRSATQPYEQRDLDLICTDPPYYDAIPYSDLMDFFHVWLRRVLAGLSPAVDEAFAEPLGPKWRHEANDGELVDQASRFGDDRDASRAAYEAGMTRAFTRCREALRDEGRLVVVFANKQPDAWGTLVEALIRAGFVVTGSWPIQTEMINKVAGGARLASSVWIVCKKRAAARPGWDSSVLDDMRANITGKLRDFWDAGIRGPDFVWAATGPALEAFSRYPVVKKANAPNQLMTVSEFLREVRRMVVDFVVGRVLTDNDRDAATGLDDVTTYYLLHRHDFGMGEAPVGGCILYALSCNLSDSALVHRYDLLSQAGRGRADELEEDEAAEDEEQTAGGGSKVRLKAWSRRRGRNLGLEAPGGRPPPLIDQVHRLMHLWRAGDQVKVDEYLDDRGLLRSALFNRILQALIELADAGSDERSLLEALSNHAAARGGIGYHQKELLTS